MEDSILLSVKQVVGVSSDSADFDLDVLTAINTALASLQQLGVCEMLVVTDGSKKWDDLGMNAAGTSLAKTYVNLSVMMSFDPPQTSYLIEARNNQLSEIQYRLVVQKEIIDE